MAVTKTVEAAKVREAVEAGQTLFGENYVQEARAKASEVSGAEWHFIGHLQTNKARQAVGLFSLIHSLDSDRLAVELDRRAKAQGLIQPVLIEVSFGEVTKTGVPEDALLPLVDRVLALPNLRLAGLMCMPPFFDEPERARPYFAQLARLKERLEDELDVELPELSMGMSGDYEVAIEEGATLVRVGTAIFGRRACALRP